MTTARRTFLTGLAGTGASVLALAACSGGNSAGGGKAGGAGSTLVIDCAFSIETGDPGNTYDPTGNTVAKAIYEPLVDYEGADVATPVPGLASWEQNDAATEFTFTLEKDRTFSSGNPVRADDVVFTMKRVIGMADAKPNFLLTGISVEKVDDATVRFTTESPMLQLPAILANPALGIVDSKVVQDNGGSIEPGKDTAQKWFETHSAGSGPYTLEKLDLTSQIVLAKNEKYTGKKKPSFDKVVIRNVTESATQALNLKGGDTMIALDLNADQAAGLGDTFTVDAVPSGQTIFLLLNQSTDVAKDLANVKIAEAVRYGLDYDALLELGGKGSVQATGVIPVGFEGALEKGVTPDAARAKKALGESGYSGQPLKLQYPNDYPVGGVEFTPLAERIQSQLEAIGLKVELAPAPFATELDAYVGGKEAFGLWFWGPDYADSTNFLPFAPGGKVGLRAGWEEKADPEIAKLAKDTAAASDPGQRAKDLTEFATALQDAGPFVPLIVPGHAIATAKDITGAAYSPLWDINIADVKPA